MIFFITINTIVLIYIYYFSLGSIKTYHIHRLFIKLALKFKLVSVTILQPRLLLLSVALTLWLMQKYVLGYIMDQKELTLIFMHTTKESLAKLEGGGSDAR